MTITSKGYTGSVNYADWAVLQSMLRAQYAVFGPDSFKVGFGTGDRGITIAAGSAGGQGVLDTSDAVETLSGGLVSTGSRWDLIALRRDWSAKKTVPVIIPGTAAMALPSGRKKFIGIQDDHPLALARFDAGQTKAGAIIDLRVWAGDGGGIVGGDLLVRDFLDRIGTRIVIAGVEWLRDRDASGLAVWDTIGEPTGKVSPFAGTIAPAGYLMCLGQAVPKSAYPKLAALLGVNYGFSNDPDLFVLPNLSGGRVPVGASSTDQDFVLGRAGGEKNHRLTVEEMPSHNHDDPQTATLKYAADQRGNGNWDGGGNRLQGGYTTNRGGDQPHNNMPPFVAMNYIIRAV